MKNPVKWRFAFAKVSEGKIELSFTAAMEDGWHIYSQFMEDGGPMPTTFSFEPNSEYETLEKVQEKSTRIEKFDPTFLIPVAWFEKTAVFTMNIKLKGPGATVKGKVEFMACTDIECLLPETVEFSIPIKIEPGEKKKANSRSQRVE